MSEVHALQKAVNSSLSSLLSNGKTLKNNLNQLKNDDNFKGQTASSINAYNDSFHIETIHRIEKIKSEFESKFKSAVDSFHSNVDNDHSAILDAERMENYKDDIKKAVNNIEQTKTRMNSTINGVHDITDAKTITGHSVKEKGTALTNFIGDTVSDFKSFQGKHAMDGAELLDMITPVAKMTSKVKDMPADRSTIAGKAVIIKEQYKIYSKDNQFTQLKKELDKYKNAAYGGNKAAKTTKAFLEIKNQLLAAYIAGDGNFYKGNELLKAGKIGILGKSKLKLINATLHTNIENIQGKRLLKAANFLLSKKNMKMSDKLVNALKMTRNYDDVEFRTIQKEMKKYTAKNPLKQGSKSFLDKVLNPKLKEALKHPKKMTLQEIEEFKSLNLLGKGGKILKYGGKILGPLGIAAIIATNAMSNKSKQRKIVDTTVDLGAMGASTATGMAVGTAIGGPIGAAVGAGVGALTGIATELKVFGGKSLTDIAKDKANEAVSRFRNSKAGEMTGKFLKSTTVFGLFS